MWAVMNHAQTRNIMTHHAFQVKVLHDQEKVHHSRRTAIFLAATEGSVDTHLNLFNAANKLLLALAGLPPSNRHHPNPAAKHKHPHRRG
jgi:hypothetical protein